MAEGSALGELVGEIGVAAGANSSLSCWVFETTWASLIIGREGYYQARI